MAIEIGRPRKSFWIVSIIALLWNLIGVAMYIMMTQITPETVAESYGQDFADIFATKPAWATGAYAVAVFAGLLGCVGLFVRKKWARLLFIISFLGIIIHNIWGVMAGTLSVIGMFDKVMTIVVMAIAIFLIWFARQKITQGVLR